MTVTSSPSSFSTFSPIDSEYLYPSLKMCPISTVLWISSGSPRFETSIALRLPAADRRTRP